MPTICMKLDPGMHIVMHLVFLGKTGVTVATCRSIGSTAQWRLNEDPADLAAVLISSTRVVATQR
jgi:hypothetical protein